MESRAYRRGIKHSNGGVVERPSATQRLDSKWRAFVDGVFSASPVLEEFTLEVWRHVPLLSLRDGTTRSESIGRPSPWDSAYIRAENVLTDLFSVTVSS